MSTSRADSPPPAAEKVDSPSKTLRRLFLTLFLRGRSSRGLKKESAPKSVGQKLALTLGFYALFGCVSLVFGGQPVFALSVYLHALTFVFLGMFVASSAGEILFNTEEVDILLHRPISAEALLWAKVRILVEVSLWLAGAFNLVGLFVGLLTSDGGWRFPIAHVFSTSLEALFCTGCVVMVYQLCLRWFGREKLNGLMTTAQVLVAIFAVLAGQILPQLVIRTNHIVTFTEKSWWIALLPPAWFAGIDDALAGSMARGSWLLAAFAVIATAVVLSIAFGKLAGDYGTGLQRMGEVASARRRERASRRWLDQIADLPPLRWWLRDRVARAAFLLAGAYLVRDRDVKLRVYPAMAPIMVLPIIFLMQSHGVARQGGGGNFGIVLAGCYLGIIPLLGLDLLRYSQQWQASDIFRAAPMLGPAALFHGARWAVLCFLALPLVVLFGLIVWIMDRQTAELLLLLPGVIAMPVYALSAGLGGKATPLSLPTEEAKSAGRALTIMVGIAISAAMSGLVLWSWTTGWFWWFITGEVVVAAVVYVALRRSLANVRWIAID